MMNYTFNSLFKFCMELAFGTQKKNIKCLEAFQFESERLKESYQNNDCEVINHLIQCFGINPSDVFGAGGLYIENVSSSNLSQWQNNILPTSNRAAFVSHAVSRAMMLLPREQVLDGLTRLSPSLDMEKMGLNLPVTTLDMYFFFTQLLSRAYKNELVIRMEREPLAVDPVHKVAPPIKVKKKHFRWAGGLLLLALLFLTGFYSLQQMKNDFVYFNDAVFEAVMIREVESAVGHKIEGKISREDALKVRSITYDRKNLETTQWNNNKPIKSILGIEAFENLEIVNFRGNEIQDISPLKALTFLKQLYVGGNQITNLEALSDLKQLLRLAVDGNTAIEDLSVLSNLGELELLNISHLKVRNIEAILALSKLKYLYAQGMTQTDLSVIAQISSIQDLYLDGTLLKSYDFLGEMKGLKYLNLPQNKIKNIGFIENLTLLEGLDIRENEIEDISPLVQMEARKEISKSKMKYLKLNQNRIKRLQGLNAFTELKRLYIWDNPIENYSEAQMVYARNLQMEKDFDLTYDFERFSGQIEKMHDEHWYVFQPKTGGVYSFFTLSQVNIQGSIGDENREKLYGGWFNEGESIRFYSEGVFEAGKTYHVKVRGHGETLGAYELFVLTPDRKVDASEVRFLGAENHFK